MQTLIYLGIVAVAFWLVVHGIDAMHVPQPINFIVKFIAGAIAIIAVLLLFFPAILPVDFR